MRVKDAIEFNQAQVAAGKLTPEHVAWLVEHFQSTHGLTDDGKAGDLQTIPALEKYILAQQPAAPDPAAVLSAWYWPLCARRGLRPKVSNKFGARRDDGRRRHAGVDIMFPRAQRGAVKKPDYLADWFLPSDQEVPVLAIGRGTVVGARWGIALNGERVLSVTIDHGHVSGYGTLGSFYLHCARLLVRPGDRVEGGQPIAIAGHTATDTTHLHFEIFTGSTRSDHQIDPAPLLAQMRYRDHEPGTGEFKPQWFRDDLPAL